MSSNGSLRKALSYCVQQVQTYDYEHYLCSLHLPIGLRSAAFTLRAFNVETSRAPESAREPNLALMRLTWWQDALDGLYKGRVLEHPVLTALDAIVKEHRLSKHWLSRIVQARILDLEMKAGAPTTLSELERYAESTASSLLYLTLEAAGVRDTAADHAASHVGKAEGIALLLRASPYHTRHRRTYIPVEVAAKHGVSQEEIFRGVYSERLADAVLDVASVASSHLAKARELRVSVPQAALPVLLPAVPVGILLDTLQSLQFNVFDPSLLRGVCGISPLRMVLQLKWCNYLKKY